MPSYPDYVYGDSQDLSSAARTPAAPSNSVMGFGPWDVTDEGVAQWRAANNPDNAA